jgi:hypothetical protein
MRIKVDKPGQIGLITDLSAPELPHNAWSIVRNMRFDSGFAQNAPGFETLDTPADPAKYLLGLTVGGTNFLVYPTADAIYSWASGVETDISRSTAYTATFPWNGCVLSGVAILNNYSDCPQYWGGSGDCIDLPYSGSDTWDDYDGGGTTTYRAKVIRSFRNFLFALGIEDDGVDYPYMVHWSHPADPGTVPSSWDWTDPTNLSGRFDLADTSGFVIDALPLRDVLVIYKDDSVWFCSYVGGQYQFRFDVFGEALGLGLYAPNCVVDIGGKHIVLGNSSVYIHDGSSVQNILRGRNAEALFSKIDPDNYQLTYLLHKQEHTEVWVCYPPIGATACTNAFVYNYAESTWSWRVIPRSFYARAVVLGDATAPSWPAAGSTDSWDSDKTKGWDDAAGDPTPATIVAVGTYLYKHSGVTTSLGNNFTCLLERTGLRFGEGGQISLIRGIYPRITGGPVKIQVGTQLTPEGTISWETQQIYNPDTDVKVDVLVSGLYHAIRFKTTGGQSWRLDGYEVDIEAVGAY